MSLFSRVAAECPQCGAPCETDLFSSVNADRRPELRDAILDDSFQGVTCDNCDAKFRLPPRFTYADFERGQWIAVNPGTEMVQWQILEAEAKTVFDDTYGARAPAAARDLGETMRPRLVFGWPAMREKLLCGEHGLDDLTLELLKLAVLRSVQRPPLADDSELRLDRVEEATLTLTWIRTATGERVTSLKVPREVYAGIAGGGEEWAALRTQLQNHLFVDMNRLLVASVEPGV